MKPRIWLLWFLMSLTALAQPGLSTRAQVVVRQGIPWMELQITNRGTRPFRLDIPAGTSMCPTDDSDGLAVLLLPCQLDVPAHGTQKMRIPVLVETSHPGPWKPNPRRPLLRATSLVNRAWAMSLQKPHPVPGDAGVFQSWLVHAAWYSYTYGSQRDDEVAARLSGMGLSKVSRLALRPWVEELLRSGHMDESSTRAFDQASKNVEKGDELLEQGRAQEALALADEAVRLDTGTFTQALHLRGRALYKLGRHQEAEADFDASLQRFGSRPWYLISRGFSRLYSGNLAGALLDAETALRKWPQNGDAHGLRASIHEKRGEPAEALAEFRLAAKFDPYYQGAVARLQGETPPAPTPASLTGRWAGSWSNSVGESGADSLLLQEDGSGNLSGTWSGNIPVQGRRLSASEIELRGANGRRNFTIRGSLEGGQLVLRYTARRLDAPGSYTGESRFQRR